ncbi:hypothetical protein [uncultured Methylobacterium sp.]|uniref:hypothetical protein n=1 Tax=uncultured Methylobacterium sp. TaxID=157278 RepID=UPI00260E56BD|nr:hypothetical protein [uncultured Methylobacterium sp.]
MEEEAVAGDRQTGSYLSSLPYEAPELSREIIAIMRREKIHPVLLFGTQSSGKTLTLQSLFQYALTNDDVNIAISLGETIWPKEHNAFALVQESGRSFLDNQIIDLTGGHLPEGTTRQSPFFVPVDLIHEGRLTRFAFMEGMGEWFQRETPGSGAEPGALRDLGFKPFKTVLSQLLGTFEHGISMIFFAPCADDPRTPSTKDFADACLANTMREAERLRGDKNRDNLLLLVNKWDAACSPGNAQDHFSDAGTGVVAERLRDWRFSWAKFAALQGFPDRARAVMPYSAAWIRPDRTVIASQQYSAIFARYNRTLWNWLYGNAQVAFADDSRTPRPVLYDDVMPKIPSRMTSMERLTRIATLNRD